MKYNSAVAKTRKVLSTAQKSAISQIAKKVVHKEAETKSAIAQSANLITDDLVYAQNMNFFLSQGLLADNIIGEKFFLKNIYIKGEVFNVNNATSNLPLHGRIMIIRTKKALTNTFASISAGDVFRGTTNRVATQGMIDLHKVDLLYDKTIYFDQPQQVNSDQSKGFTINLKINKTHFVEGDSGGYLKDKNYYLIYTANKTTSTATNTSYLRFQWTLNFKDM